VLNLVMSIAFEVSININQPESYLIKNPPIFGACLCLLNVLAKRSTQWHTEAAVYITYLVKSIEGSYVNYSLVSNVNLNRDKPSTICSIRWSN
jgi:hypothetical protein